MEDTKVCSKCKESQPVTAFAVDTSKKSGRQSQCRACKNKPQETASAEPVRKDVFTKDEWLAVRPTHRALPASIQDVAYQAYLNTVRICEQNGYPLGPDMRPDRTARPA
jgi:hypothetical protein